MRRVLVSPLLCLVVALVVGCGTAGEPTPVRSLAQAAGPAPVVIGETVQLASRVLGERRVINIYLPPGYAKTAERYPVLYMPDGGVEEDFVHIVGAIDVSIRNQLIRPMLVVGIENIERRRDLAGPTTIAEEHEMAPHAGGADRFRGFLRDELKPYIAAHYRVTNESAIVGESLAGLFVVETLLTTPELFDSYIAISPSLWWNGQATVRGAAARFTTWSAGPKTLFLSTASDERLPDSADILLAALEAARPPGLVWHYLPLPDEHHNSIYPIASVKAFRTLFALPAQRPSN